RETTHGIQLDMLSVSHPTKSDTVMNLNTWDFGGQEVYRITHQFFYSKRSLYLLVWRPREGAEDNSVLSWLERIRLRVSAKDARVIIVATHSRERRAEIDEPGIRSRYGEMICGFFEVDNKTRDGIDDLR